MARRQLQKTSNTWDSITRKSYGTLFERLLAEDENQGAPQDKDPLRSQVRSIKRHLNKLLNARAGNSASAPHLGIADFNDGSAESNDMIRFITRSIHECINEFEPRIRLVSIAPRPDFSNPLNLRFSIVASLPIGHRREQVEIDLLLDDHRKARIL